MSQEAPSGRLATRWRRLLRPLTLLLLVLSLWLIVVALTLFWARGDANRGLDAVEEAQRRTSPADLAKARPLDPLRRAQRSFDSSERLLGSPVLAPVRLLPVLGRQLRSGHALMGAAARMAGTGADAIAEAKAAIDGSHASGPERVGLLRRLAGVADETDRRLANLDVGPGRALLAPLASRRNELLEKLAEVRAGLRDGRAVAQGLADMLAGPRRYLVLAANNSEMRAGSGAFLSAGELSLSGGEISLTEFRPTSDLAVPAHVAPPVEDPDLAARWGFLEPNRAWHNLGLTPRFAPNAALAARMWPLVGGRAVEGVLVIDPLALRGVLRATGPVLSEGRPVSAENVAGLLLHDQYVGINTFDVAAQAGRREQLGSIARAALDALRRGDWDVAELARGLAEAARGRHLLAWAQHPSEQRAWEAARVDGRLQPASLAVGVLNRGGNKLDHFLEVDAHLGFEAGDRFDEATLRLVLQNTTPDGESLYITGPYPGVAAGPGDYVGLLTVNLPAAASSVTLEGRETFAAAGPDGPTRVLAVPIVVRRGGAQSFTFRFRLPPRHGPLRVEPSARSPAVTWETPRRTFRSGEARRVPVP